MSAIIQKVLPEVTFGVTSNGNTRGLCLCLLSVLSGTYLPRRICIRLEGSVPGFNDFYLEQLAEVARLRGVDFLIYVAKPEGIRSARDWLVSVCCTRYLWMGDDDVVFDHDVLDRFLGAIILPEWAALVGNKRDVNNRRGYGNFSADPVTTPLLANAPTYLHYDKGTYTNQFVRIVALDTGFCLLDTVCIQGKSVRFSLFPVSFNSGGEDNLFGIALRHAGLSVLFIPSAQAYHLEKERATFANESVMRAEMIIRSAEAAGLADGKTEFEIFPWLKPHKRKD